MAWRKSGFRARPGSRALAKPRGGSSRPHTPAPIITCCSVFVCPSGSAREISFVSCMGFAVPGLVVKKLVLFLVSALGRWGPGLPSVLRCKRAHARPRERKPSGLSVRPSGAARALASQPRSRSHSRPVGLRARAAFGLSCARSPLPLRLCRSPFGASRLGFPPPSSGLPPAARESGNALRAFSFLCTASRCFVP